MKTSPRTLITGASSGIGLHLARALAARGHLVTGVARRQDRLDALAREIPGFSPRAVDLASPPSRAALADGLLSEGQVPDYLILNAGLAHYGALHLLTPAQVTEMLEVNVAAVIDLCQRLLPAMLERRSGRIVIVSSVLGVGAVPWSAVYCGTKGAVNNFVRGMRLDLAGTGVRVSVMCPAGVDTEFHGVATGAAGKQRKGSEPVDRVVAGMVRQLDRDTAVIYPTFRAHLSAVGFRLFPRVTEFFLSRVRLMPALTENIPPERLLR